MKNLIKTVTTNVNTNAKLLVNKWNELPQAEKDMILVTANSMAMFLTVKLSKDIDRNWIIPAIEKRSPNLAKKYTGYAKSSYQITHALTLASQLITCVKYAQSIKQK